MIAGDKTSLGGACLEQQQGEGEAWVYLALWKQVCDDYLVSISGPGISHLLTYSP